MMTTLPHRGVLGCACAMMALVTIGAGAQTPTQLDGVKPFQAFGPIDPTSIAVNITCSDGNHAHA